MRVDVLRGMVRRHARRAVRGVEIVAANDDDRHAVAPRVVDRHGRVLQSDDAVHQGQQRLARDLEIAVRHGDGRFFVHASDVFRHLVAAVVDQRLMQRAETRGAIRRHVFDVERLDDIDHEIGTGLARDTRHLLRHVGFGGDGMRGRRQRRRQPCRHAPGRDGARAWRRRHGCGAGHGCSGQKFATIYRLTRILARHRHLPEISAAAIFIACTIEYFGKR